MRLLGRPRTLLAFAAPTVAALALAACGGDPLDDGTPPPANPQPSATVPAPAPPTTAPAATPTLPGDLDGVAVRLDPVATLDEPLDLVTRPGDPDRVYVAERGGRIRVLDAGGVRPEPLLDISAQTTATGERGLLGIAFSPDGSHLYVSSTDLDGNSHVDEYAMAGDAVDVASRRQVLFQTQPFPNHNGGGIVFGPDGLLYVGLGDGGSAGDPLDQGQDRATLLGKILRIDPRPAGTDPYGIPADNPFAGEAGARAEIWSWGLRNPWRFSFDPGTGDLWIADVGQNEVEEVTRLPAGPDGAGRGANLGWKRYEGDQHFSGNPATDDLVMPTFTYTHAETGGCSITGGVVYRGTAIPDLAGAYLFSDVCTGGVTALTVAEDGTVRTRDLGVDIPQVVGFGTDAAGEVYVLSLSGPVARLAPA